MEKHSSSNVETKYRGRNQHRNHAQADKQVLANDATRAAGQSNC